MMMINEVNPPLEEVIEHYGVKGMKWGVRRSAEQLNNARKRRDQEILDARAKVPEMRDKRKQAKAEYKRVKKETDSRKDEGRRAAKEALKEARKAESENWQTSQKKTLGEYAAQLAMTKYTTSPNTTLIDSAVFAVSANKAADAYNESLQDE